MVAASGSDIPRNETGQALFPERNKRPMYLCQNMPAIGPTYLEFNKHPLTRPYLIDGIFELIVEVLRDKV